VAIRDGVDDSGAILNDGCRGGGRRRRSTRGPVFDVADCD
jgi:hypothetical protein